MLGKKLRRLQAAALVSALIALTFAGCSKSEDLQTCGTVSQEGRRVGFVFDVEKYQGDDSAAADGTKSSMDPGLIDCLYDINALVIDPDGCYCASLSEYFADYRQCALHLPDDGLSYKVYFLANAGYDITCDFDDGCEESCLKEWQLYSDDLLEDFSSTGLPFVGKVVVSESDGAYVALSLKRLYSRWLVRIDASALESCGFSVNSVRVCNGAAELYPFSDESRSTSGSDLCDCADEDDCLDIMNDRIVLYTLENCQGCLLPDSSGPADRTYSKVQEEAGLSDEEMGLLTYIEIDASVSTMTADYDHVRYRFYLGENQSSSFDVRRNRSTEVDVRLTKELVISQEWRLEPDEPGEIHQVVSSSAETLFVAPGVEGEVTITYPEGFEYSVELDDLANEYGLQCIRTCVSGTQDRLVFSTTRCDDWYVPPYLTDPGDNLEEELYSDRQCYLKADIKGVDGIVQKTIVLDCLTAPLGCWYSLDKCPMVMIPNRNGFTFDCTLEFTIYGKGYLGTYSSGGTLDFTISPEEGTWWLWTSKNYPYRTEAGGWTAFPTDITDYYDELYSRESAGYIRLIGSVSDLTVKCVEYPGLKIKLGERPLEFMSSSWRLYGYQPWSIGTDESLSDYGILMSVTSLDSPVSTWSDLEDRLRSSYELHTVNGNPDFKVR